MDDLIKQLIKKDPTISIVLDDYPNVFICPAILTKGSTCDPKKVGKIEYQVSDGMPGERGRSYDCYTWIEAKKATKKMADKRD